MKFPLFPAEASHLARQVDYLFWTLMLLSAVTVMVVFVPIIFFLFKFRRGKKADRRPVELPELRMELTWTIAPIIIFTGLFVWASNLYSLIQRPPADAMDISVVGKQWMWKIQHPEGNREINELHVPLGRNIRLTLASQDVIHSFFLPAFRVKQDVVPGRYTTLWFKADKPGTFYLFCSEFCGTDHSRMNGHIVVMKPADYQDWLARGAVQSTLAQEGERLYRDLGCSGCHEGSTVVHAPPLRGLYGRYVPVEDGRFVWANEAYLRDSILLPAQHIAAGYSNVMPSFQGRVSEEQLFAMVEFLKQAGNPASPARGNE